MSYEKNIPTEQDKKKKITRLPRKNGDQRWTQSLSPQKTKRQMAAHCLSFSFTKSMHVRKKWEFNQIRRRGIKYYGRFICFQYTPLDSTFSKLGLTVSRKYGNAAQRNFLKRRSRELFRRLQSNFPQNINLNILPLVHTKNASFEQLEDDWNNFITHLNKGIINGKNTAQPLSTQSLQDN
ncbi:MAG: Ribonuclease P protein component [Chlamydiia bacterium]|nr:Ribonuclease P protein component [Chlamydiia bacterium]